MTKNEYLHLRKMGVSDEVIANIIYQDNYYNGTLNKYIGQSLPNVMTSIDADGIQVKKARNLIRFIEYKHSSEKIGIQQEDTLNWLSEIAKIFNEHDPYHTKMEVFIVRGDRKHTDDLLEEIQNPKFEYLKVFDCITRESFSLKGKEDIDEFLMLETNEFDNYQEEVEFRRQIKLKNKIHKGMKKIFNKKMKKRHKRKRKQNRRTK